MTRTDKLHARLTALCEAGALDDYIVYAPGDRGLRWNVWGEGIGDVVYGYPMNLTRTFSTRECENACTTIEAVLRAAAS